ncbi:efflux RND transporter periplasmic adaptor subunit [Haliscomenobacter hydrossis]|uniref:Efflux transporter, RND family, MFP subunit n=1 Tax=Haliscomenobacter hydrossis (strain ATCC 27775 / DSM 1100 / LMG 10767 / O) TaxID=760192 RepID=F4KWK2_HALH1|nr:efflux RND transporter periplasmic adaptor subunit [Haliscomenobacter hydrossis]AEE51342.1 efflux transporter, RND family, MFP subunit [Haliscomenobacter hydrossis DSM 1100]
MKPKYTFSPRTFLPFATLLLGLVLGYLIFGQKKGQKHSASDTEATAQVVTYTCSMHPQIRQNEPGTCPLCEMDLTPIDATVSNDPLVLEMSEAAIRLADIQTTTVGLGQNAGKKLSLSGKIQPDERAASTQVAHIPGRIEQLFISFTGEQVRKGQAVARMYSPPLVAAQQELLEAIRFKGKDSELAEAARSKLRYWKVSDAFIQKVEEGGKIQREITLYADRSGVVMTRKVAVGDYVEEGSALFELSNLSQLWALFEAYEADLAHIRVGNAVQFTTPSLPNRRFTGRIAFIDPLIDPQSRTASLRAEIQNPGGLLKPEMFIQGELSASTSAKSALEVPKTAVLWTGKRSVVYLKKPDSELPSFEYREVELGESTSNAYLILSGLQAGDEVVTNGAFVIDAAAQLNNQQSMMNQLVKAEPINKSAIPDFKANTPTVFLRDLDVIIQLYLKIKNALVESNQKGSRNHATALLILLDKMKDLPFLEKERAYWKAQSSDLRLHLGLLKNAKNIETQRVQFDHASQILIRILKAYGPGMDQGAIYVQHCPMAFNNRGADWLSGEEKVLNPYFGDEMLNCGFVKENLVQ